MKLLAVDPSLRSTGWALFEGKQIAHVGIISAPGPEFALASRLSVLQKSVTELIARLEMKAGDVLICEGPAPLVLNPATALKVEHVRGIFESVARSAQVTVPGRINPRTLQSELLGFKGKQLSRTIVKESARQVAFQLYGKEFQSVFGMSVKGERKKQVPQDVIDAALIGTLALTKIRLAQSSGMDLVQMFAERSSARRSRRGYR